nr:MAG TPA: YjcQ protein [Caudoviricetes sp.]
MDGVRKAQKRKEVMRMASNDYFVIVHKILTYLYECLKSDKDIDFTLLSSESLCIGEKYYRYILSSLISLGYVDGLKEVKSIRGEDRGISITTSGVRISPKGIYFLFCDDVMKQFTS